MRAAACRRAGLVARPTPREATRRRAGRRVSRLAAPGASADWRAFARPCRASYAALDHGNQALCRTLRAGVRAGQQSPGDGRSRPARAGARTLRSTRAPPRAPPALASFPRTGDALRNARHCPARGRSLRMVEAVQRPRRQIPDAAVGCPRDVTFYLSRTFGGVERAEVCCGGRDGAPRTRPALQRATSRAPARLSTHYRGTARPAHKHANRHVSAGLTIARRLDECTEHALGGHER
jgi:hypothetical protein